MKKVLYGIIPLLVLGLFLVGIAYSTDSNYGSSNELTEQELGYKGDVGIYTTGDFEGRETPAGEGVWELVQLKHNQLFNTGADMVRDALMVGSGAVNNITLCNATSDAGCGDPAADQSETYNEITSCGLEGATGTVTALGQVGNFTVTNTFTSTCDAVEVNVTRLSNNTDYFAGNSFTKVTLQTNDQITVNWTIQVS